MINDEEIKNLIEQAYNRGYMNGMIFMGLSIIFLLIILN